MYMPIFVQRGVDGFDIAEGESHVIDHLVFMIHGIGCQVDMQLRTIVEAVDAFRSVTLDLLDAHFCSSKESGRIGRVEVLPISWHHLLHGDGETGLDSNLKLITLPTIPVLRSFANSTVLDVLFYTSPIYNKASSKFG